MPQSLNFDEVVYDTITITKQGRTWRLRDDVPMAVMVRVFALQALGERIQEETAQLDPQTTKRDEAQLVIERAFAKTDAEATSILAAIFRHTDGSVTDEQIGEMFTYEEKGAIIQAFFTHRLGVSSAPSTAISDDGEMPATTPAPAPALQAGQKPRTQNGQNGQRTSRASQTGTRRGTTHPM